ncbi:MAG: peptide deformylase [Elusimicrobia bacterium]|nr:peptide deformylase [Elusimicrobiota bacterium]
MSKLKIYKYGEPILRQKCKPVEQINSQIKKLISDMFETMYNAPGVGLAAPQVGVSLNLCLIDPNIDGKKQPIALINPKIVDKKGKIFEEEGCLSFPGILAKVKRFENIKVEAVNEKGLPIIVQGTGILSRIIQHEMDHLNGKLFVDYLSFFKRKKIESEIRKRKKSGTW